jgi:hypothetical protein
MRDGDRHLVCEEHGSLALLAMETCRWSVLDAAIPSRS